MASSDDNSRIHLNPRFVASNSQAPPKVHLNPAFISKNTSKTSSGFTETKDTYNISLKKTQDKKYFTEQPLGLYSKSKENFDRINKESLNYKSHHEVLNSSYQYQKFNPKFKYQKTNAKSNCVFIKESYSNVNKSLITTNKSFSSNYKLDKRSLVSPMNESNKVISNIYKVNNNSSLKKVSQGQSSFDTSEKNVKTKMDKSLVILSKNKLVRKDLTPKMTKSIENLSSNTKIINVSSQPKRESVSLSRYKLVKPIGLRNKCSPVKQIRRKSLGRHSGSRYSLHTPTKLVRKKSIEKNNNDLPDIPFMKKYDTFCSNSLDLSKKRKYKVISSTKLVRQKSKEYDNHNQDMNMISFQSPAQKAAKGIVSKYKFNKLKTITNAKQKNKM